MDECGDEGVGGAAATRGGIVGVDLRRHGDLCIVCNRGGRGIIKSSEASISVEEA